MLNLDMRLWIFQDSWIISVDTSVPFSSACSAESESVTITVSVMQDVLFFLSNVLWIYVMALCTVYV